MKKIIFAVVFMLVTNIGVFAATATTTTTTNWDSAAALNRVNTIGNKIVKANGIGQAITFKVSDQADVNAYANINKEVYVYRGLLEYVTNDDELAGVISHELGHILNGHCAKQGVLNTGVNILANATAKVTGSTVAAGVGQQLATSKLSRKDEFEADTTGVDLMTKAGYNPLAMISVLNKICGNYIDILQTHPSGEKRLLNIYNYVEYNYPAKLKTGFKTDSYTKALALLTPTVQKRKASEKLTKKYEKEQKKLLEKKQKRMAKAAKKSTVWDGYYTTLQLMAQ
ncbi:MAG: M48 family metallopeptidase [Cyanobacteria bacterium RUI128]|nr:M48 family metallopeptidase [Cyanobacteria bacterium RUI128]